MIHTNDNPPLVNGTSGKTKSKSSKPKKEVGDSPPQIDLVTPVVLCGHQISLEKLVLMEGFLQADKVTLQELLSR